LARAHDLLTKRHWGDAPLDALAREVLTPLAGDAAGQIRIAGPPVALNSRTALSLTMALNELATNAIKYGALSSATGSLSVAWQLQGETELVLEWCERGGPPVTPPTRRGFGTRLMERCIERDLGGEFDLAFDPAGVSARILVPVGLLHA
ncbi:HWE histidine kinase domain-containing protein, partial [Rhizobium sp. LCM 4573]|uniref:HWE histidine kinase domain-containing protein n=1 Tax=Rhizobium sp. LCM 4573 TaxID=1848291 RepID=UPI000AED8FAB